jgi:geranylgeranyl reductase family protein
MSKYDIIVVGGGPAGTAAAITAARAGQHVLLLERGRLPRQKVCGEFVSAEGVETLRELDPETAERLLDGAPRIRLARLFVDTQTVAVPVEPEAASITRYALDHALWSAAEAAGAECRQEIEAQAVEGEGPYRVTVVTAEGGCPPQELEATALIDASGRWSRLRRGSGTLPQPTGRRRCIGLKAHFATGELAVTTQASVDLYFFEGGYCGVQPISEGRTNACAMVRADRASSLAEVFALHPALAERSRGWRAVGEAVATSPLVFERPRPVRDQVLCAGDAAGFVDPFIGDGITLALRSGRLAAEAAMRGDVEWYAREYRARLQPVFGNASWLRWVMDLPRLLRKPIVAAMRSPGVGRALVRSTRAR